jgi:hypothetical protein
VEAFPFVERTIAPENLACQRMRQGCGIFVGTLRNPHANALRIQQFLI